MHIREMTNILQLIKGYFILNKDKNLVISQYLLNILSPKLELHIHQKPEFKTCTFNVFFSFFCWSHCISQFDEILFSTDSALHSGPYSAPQLNMQKLSVLVPSLKTINQAIVFTQDTSHFSFISKEKNVLSTAEDFRNIYFLQHFDQFSQWMRCAIFYINTGILTNQKRINIFTQETL